MMNKIMIMHCFLFLVVNAFAESLQIPKECVVQYNYFIESEANSTKRVFFRSINPNESFYGKKLRQNTRSGKSSGGGTCFTGDTPILMADGTDKDISAIKPGDRVRSYDHDHKKFVVGIVESTQGTADKVVCRLHSDIGYIDATPDHPFYSGEIDAYMPVTELLKLRENYLSLVSKDDFGVVSMGSRLSIKQVEYIGKKSVYNFTVKKYHNYIAGGVLVHNR